MLWTFGVFVICADGYVRLAPSDPARWHVDPREASDPGRAGTLQRRVGDLAGFDRAVAAEPRMTLLAGGPQEGRATYVARSLVWGFPDYVSVAEDGADLVILSRLRFGGSDLGANAARLERLFQRM